jgi:hypothetical protein
MDYSKLKKKIKQNKYTIEYFCLNVMGISARAHFENGSSIVWHGFRVIISSMKNITGSLSYLYKTKKFYAQSHQIRAIEARIIILENQLNEWGSDLKPA